jgi:PAS domain-containing protein
VKRNFWQSKYDSTPGRAALGMAIIAVVFMLALSGYIFFFRQSLYQARQSDLQQIVALAVEALSPVLDDRRKGRLSIGEARVKAAQIASRFIYYDRNGPHYLYMISYDGYVLAEPLSPESVGTYQMQRRDPSGAMITRQQIEKAKNGGGFVDFLRMGNPGGDPQNIMSYVYGIQDLECLIGTSLDLADIDQSVLQLWWRLSLLGLAILLLVSVAQYYFLRPLLECLAKLSDSFCQLGRDPSRAAAFSITMKHHTLDTKQALGNFSLMIRQIEQHSRSVAKNEEKYRRIVYMNSDVTWEWDAATQVTAWHGNIEKFIGTVPSGRDTHFETEPDWVHPDDRDLRAQALAKHLSRKTPVYTCQYRLLNSQKKTETPVLVRGVATFNDNGTVLRMVGSMLELSAADDPVQPQPRSAAGGELATVVGNYSLLIPGIAEETLVCDVKERLDKERWPGIVILRGAKPIGLVMKTALDYMLSTHYGLSLYSKKPVGAIMDDEPLIVDSDTPLDQVATLVRQRKETNQYDLIIIAKGENYCGVLSVIDMVTHLSTQQIKLAANANPLTGLPGNLMIEERLKAVVRQQEHFSALYVDLDHFKAFNDKYGFEHGDLVLLKTAGILQEVVARDTRSTSVFLGHIGGDDFLLLLPWDEDASVIAAKYSCQNH